MKKILLKHIGNMGDMVFIIPPVLAALKKKYPESHITFVTAWGYKDKKGRWGKRNQGGHSISLLMTDPHIDQLVHWHDTKLSLDGDICVEEGRSFPTWNREYFEREKESDHYDMAVELDFGLKIDDNPLTRMYEAVGLPADSGSQYKLYLTEQDKRIASYVMTNAPRPRIALLESLSGPATRSWDPAKVKQLETAIQDKYKVAPIWFGSRYTPEYQGRPLTLRENIATLLQADVGIGVLSGPLHFAVAVGLPTLTLYCDHPVHRAAPGYFLNQYISDPKKKHRTLLGPSPSPMQILKYPGPSPSLTPAEAKRQEYTHWSNPGQQSTKSGLAVITVTEVMTVLQEMI